MPNNNRSAVMDVSRIEDLPATATYAEAQEDSTPAQFCGDWTTTNSASRGIARIVVQQQGDRLSIHAFGASPSQRNDWGIVPAYLFNDGAHTRKVRAFFAQYDFGFMATDLQAKTEKGVLVVASFNRFKDGSGRPSYFSREFFYRDSMGGKNERA